MYKYKVKILLALSFCFLFFFYISQFDFVKANDDEKTLQEAYELFIQNVENIEILEYAKDKWGDDDIMVQYEYYNQLEALNWIEQQSNSEEILREGREEFGDDYTLMKYQHEREVATIEAIDGFVVTVFLAILLFNFLFLLFFIKDILKRKERLILWIPFFLFAAPIASIFYRTFRKPQDGEVVKESKIHNFAKNFLVLWPISIISAFIFFFSALLIIDWFGGQNVDIQFIGEALFWFGSIFACVVIPTVVIFPVMIATLIMFLTKPTLKGDNRVK